MKERPILMSTPMVQAILAGRKTQTRRIVKPQPNESFTMDYKRNIRESYGWSYQKTIEHPYLDVKSPCMNSFCPYGQVGDRLWVKEGWAVSSHSKDYVKQLEILYKTIHDDNNDRKWVELDLDTWAKQSLNNKWRSGRFMFKWASRITLEITEIRVQRLQEISEEDAEQEGIIRNEQHNAIYWFEVFGEYHGHTQSVTRKEAYQKLWDSINGKKHPWSTSPYVWVLTFKRV